MKLLNNSAFIAAAGGTGNFAVTLAVLGAVTPVQAGAMNGLVYSYCARSVDNTQWEIGRGAYSTSGPTLARTTIILSSAGNAKVNFTSPPQVTIDALVEDFQAVFDSVADAQTSGIPAATNIINVRGYFAPGDLGEATYARVASPPAHGGKLQTQDGSWWEIKPMPSVRFEHFGCVGNNVADDTAALAGLAAFARIGGQLRAFGQKGKTYTNTAANWSNGIPIVEIDGQGCNFANPTGLDVYQGPTPFNENNFMPYVSWYNNQIKIKTAQAGQGFIQTLDGSPMPTGRVLVLGFNRMQGTDSFPFCCSMFQFNAITNASGSTGILEFPLQHMYDQNWPEAQRPPTTMNLYGPAAILMLDRAPNPSYSWDYGYTQSDLIDIRNINFIAKPNFSSHGNGRVTFSGGQYLRVQNCTATNVYITCAKDVELLDFKCINYFEIDKMVERVVMRRVKTTQLAAGLAVKTIEAYDCEIPTLNTLAPTELLYVRGGRWGNGGGGGIFGDYVYGSKKTVYEKVKATVNNQNDRVGGCSVFKAPFTVVNNNTLSLNRELYTSSSIAHSAMLDVGGVFRNLLGYPAFRISRMPYSQNPSLAIASMAWYGGANTSLVWGATAAAGAPGVTATTVQPHGMPIGATFLTYIGNTTPSGYNNGNVPVNCTATDANHFTYPLAGNPGTCTAPGSFHTANIRATTVNPHGLPVGVPATLVIAQALPFFCSGTYTVTVIDGSTFDFPIVTGNIPVAGLIYDAGTGLVTATTPVPHNLANGSVVQLAGQTPSGFGGIYAITVVDPTHFTYARTNPGVITVLGNYSVFGGTASQPGVYGSGDVFIDGTPLVSSFASTPIANVALSWAAGIATVQTAAHGFTIGAKFPIIIAGVTPSGYNGTQPCTVTDATHFTFPLASDPGGAATVVGTYATNTLYLLSSPDIELRDIEVQGPFPNQVTTYAGTSNFALPYPANRIRDKSIGDNAISLSSDMNQWGRTSNKFWMSIGNQFQMTDITVNVTKPASQPAGSQLTLFCLDGNGVATTLFTKIDLGTAGRRIVDRTGTTLLGTDSNAGGILAVPTNMLQWSDTSAAFAFLGAVWTQLALASVTWAAGYATAQTVTPHGLNVGSVYYLGIAGNTPDGYNGIVPCTIIDASTFTYPVYPNPGASSVLGTAGWSTVQCGAHGLTLFSNWNLFLSNCGNSAYQTYAISALTWSTEAGGTLFATTAVPHFMDQITRINITGASPAAYNMNVYVTPTGPNTFRTYVQDNPAGGSVGSGAATTSGNWARSTPTHNGLFPATIVDATHFTIPMPLNPGTVAASGLINNPNRAEWTVTYRGAWVAGY